MSFSDLWPRRRPVLIHDHEQLEEELAELESVRRLKLPPDLEQGLANAMDDFGGKNKRLPTAKQLADEVYHLKQELVGARQLVADGEAKVAKLEAQLAERLDVEIAELERLRPKTGETHATTDADRCNAGPAGDVTDGGGEGVPDAAGGPQGKPDSAPPVPTDRS